MNVTLEKPLTPRSKLKKFTNEIRDYLMAKNLTS